ncbi:hypothetical protein [Kineosporia succinea]|uniref:Integral membrane protein n=1 Tax=Kineosporia succinea TaxID=84632 RepID=A0ABT9P2V8_9ACTN|nr:hypothetical protein [Kineosporia succinea]MDP9827022.1 hypothetical protein [Kineosporia succinea]
MDDPRTSGPGRVLVAVYAIFALAATARGITQILTKFDEAPLAYVLSLLSGIVYIVATVALARPGALWRRVALGTCAFELVGVVTVGVLTLVDSGDFPDDTVWTNFGQGYGYVPLVLPMIGLYWLYRTRPRV